MTELVDVGFHEFDADWVFEYDDGEPVASGLKPYYGIVHTFRDANAQVTGTADVNGRTFEGRLVKQDSGIGALNHPGCEFDVINEYRLHWRLADDPAGQCSGSFHIRPRAPDMETEDGESINTPAITGVAVRAQGSNLPFDEYLDVFRGLITSMGISRRYWRDTHLHVDSYSHLKDGEVYVRLADGSTGQLIGVDGPLVRIANLLASDREGYSKLIRDDRDREGYYHTATIGDKRASELVDFHRFAKEVKHYFGDDSESVPDDHPLAHPKLCVSFQTSKTDRTLYWGDLERFQRELEEVLLNVLRWEGYPITAEATADGHPYVESDPYFDPSPSHRQRRLVEDPTPEIRERQENLVLELFATGLEESDRDVLQYLVEDGGHVEPFDIADDTDWHYQTIYNAIDRLEDLVEHEYADLKLRSHYVAQQVSGALQELKNAGQNAIETAAEALEMETSMELANDALVHWVDEYGVDVEDRAEASLLLRFDTAFPDSEDLVIALTEGFYNWGKAGLSPKRFLKAEIQCQYLGRPVTMRVHHFLGNARLPA